MDLERLNRLTDEEAKAELFRCCGSSRWVEAMLEERPFESTSSLFEACDRHLGSLKPEDWQEAFTHHPRIGDATSLRSKFASTAAWASREQAGAAAAEEAVLEALSRGNQLYEAKFGFIFIVCASGKSGPEMLELLESRLGNEPSFELDVAASEQSKITRLRLEKLLA